MLDIGNGVIAACSGYTIQLWNLHTAKLVSSFPCGGHHSAARMEYFEERNSICLCSTGDAGITEFDIKTGQTKWRFKGEDGRAGFGDILKADANHIIVEKTQTLDWSSYEILCVDMETSKYTVVGTLCSHVYMAMMGDKLVTMDSKAQVLLWNVHHPEVPVPLDEDVFKKIVPLEEIRQTMDKLWTTWAYRVCHFMPNGTCISVDYTNIESPKLSIQEKEEETRVDTIDFIGMPLYITSSDDRVAVLDRDGAISIYAR